MDSNLKNNAYNFIEKKNITVIYRYDFTRNMKNICGLFTSVAGIIMAFLWFFSRLQKINLF